VLRNITYLLTYLLTRRACWPNVSCLHSLDQGIIFSNTKRHHEGSWIYIARPNDVSIVEINHSEREQMATLPSVCNVYIYMYIHTYTQKPCTAGWTLNSVLCGRLTNGHCLHLLYSHIHYIFMFYSSQTDSLSIILYAYCVCSQIKLNIYLVNTKYFINMYTHSVDLEY